MPVDPKLSQNVDFPEALDYLRQKVSVPTERWDDVLDAEHNSKFVIAGAKGSLLNDMRKVTEKAIAQGLTPKELLDSEAFQTFSAGWSDEKKDWRARVIVETNLRQAYSAGRYGYQHDPDVAAAFPYLKWVHGDSRQPRPVHVALDGQVFRVGEEPMSLPNGFGCRCRYVSLRQKDLDKQIAQGRAEFIDKPRDSVDWEGKSYSIKPEKGFDYFPDQPSSQTRAQMLEGVTAGMPTELKELFEGEAKAIDKELEKAKDEEWLKAKFDVETLEKLYRNKRATLTAEERDSLRELGLKPDEVRYPDLKKAREREFALRQRQDAETEEAKPIPQGAMTVAEANAALTSAERARLKAILDPPEGRNYSRGRLDLASSRDMAEQIARDRRELGLSVEEIQALRNYTANGYVGVNGALRGLQEDPSADLAQAQRLVARAANQALKKLPAYEGDVRRDSFMSKAELESLEAGSTISLKGITSCSTDLSGGSSSDYGQKQGLNKTNLYSDVAQRGGIKQGLQAAERVTYTIETDQGRNLGVISTRGFEKEIVLPHGWEGEVTEIKKTPTGWEIKLSDKNIKKPTQLAGSLSEDRPITLASQPTDEEQELYLMRQSDPISFEIVL